MKVDIKDLQSLRILAEEGNFSRAAVRLHIAQPALSVRMKELEERIGFRLIERSTRHVKLNAAGQVLCDEAQKILLHLSQAIGAARSASRGETGTLRIGYTKRASYSLLPSLLRRLSMELPEVRLEIHDPMTTEALYSSVAARELDLALTYLQEALDPQLAWEHLTANELVLVLPSGHPLANEEQVDLRLLADEAFVGYPSSGGFHLRKLMDAECEKAGFRPLVTNESSDTEALLCFVATGRYASILPREVEAYGFEGLAYCRIAGSQPRAVHGAVWHRKNTNPPLPAALHMLREIAKSREP